MNQRTRAVAFGGMLTAAAVVIMSMGSIIPVNTYLCPVICILLSRPLLSMFGRRTAACYYGAVSVLSLFLAPDREAAAVYLLLGYYPLLKPTLDRVRPKWLSAGLKALLFAAAGAGTALIMMAVVGVDVWSAEMKEAGELVTTLTCAMWLVLFFLVDRLLGLSPRKRK